MSKEGLKKHAPVFCFQSRVSIFLATIAVPVLVSCYGCVNLTGIREFAKISADTATYQGITQDFVASLESASHQAKRTRLLRRSLMLANGSPSIWQAAPWKTVPLPHPK